MLRGDEISEDPKIFNKINHTKAPLQKKKKKKKRMFTTADAGIPSCKNISSQKKVIAAIEKNMLSLFLWSEGKKKEFPLLFHSQGSCCATGRNETDLLTLLEWGKKKKKGNGRKRITTQTCHCANSKGKKSQSAIW